MGDALSARPFSKRRTKRAAVSVAVFSRFAIYANVVGWANRGALHNVCGAWRPTRVMPRANIFENGIAHPTV